MGAKCLTIFIVTLFPPWIHKRVGYDTISKAEHNCWFSVQSTFETETSSFCESLSASFCHVGAKVWKLDDKNQIIRDEILTGLSQLKWYELFITIHCGD